MSIYIIIGDNADAWMGNGLPTRARVVGPFPSPNEANVWGNDPRFNINKAASWMLVDLPNPPAITLHAIESNVIASDDPRLAIAHDKTGVKRHFTFIVSECAETKSLMASCEHLPDIVIGAASRQDLHNCFTNDLLQWFHINNYTIISYEPKFDIESGTIDVHMHINPDVPPATPDLSD